MSANRYEPPFKRTAIAALLVGPLVVIAMSPESVPCSLPGDASLVTCLKESKAPKQYFYDIPEENTVRTPTGVTGYGILTPQPSLAGHGLAIASATGTLEPSASVPLVGEIANVEPVPHTI